VSTPEPVVTVSQYTVSCLPSDHPEQHHFAVVVRSRGDGRWTVSDGFDYFAPTGEYSADPWPMSENDALELAKRIAPTMVVQGHTVAEALARGGGQ